jgi:transposase
VKRTLRKPQRDFIRKFYCNNCQKYPTEQLVWVGNRQRFTQRYQEYIYERVKESSCEQISRSEDLSADQVQRIFSRIAQIELKKKTGVLHKD